MRPYLCITPNSCSSCLVFRRLFCSLTVGDFSAQAVVNTILTRAFPDDKIVGEEDAADLREESGVALRNRIVELANETLTTPLQPDERESWGLGPGHAQTPGQIMDVIDHPWPSKQRAQVDTLRFTGACEDPV